MKTPRLTPVAVTALLATCIAAQATTILVPGQQPTIQAGIDAASYGDTVLVACDTYYEHDIVMKSGVALVSETGLVDCVTVDAEHLGRVIYCVDVDDAASIVGFTLSGGIALGGAAREDSIGAGIYCRNSSLALTNVSPVANTSGLAGGGLYCEDSSPTLTYCAFFGNTAEVVGGGMFCSETSAPSLTDCWFAGNGSAAGGGMGCSGSTSTLTDCWFTGNTADDGAGMIADLSQLVITGCKFIGNTASTNGGGATICECSLTLTDCVFDENFASDSGGGLRLGRNATATITNCTFSGNAANNGGAVWLHAEGPEGDPWFTAAHFSRGTRAFAGRTASRRETAFENCTFVLNQATEGGAILCHDDATVTLTNSIIAATATGGAIRCSGLGSPTLSCCDVYYNYGGDWFDCIAGQDLINDNFSADPLFCDLPAGDFTIDANSPCCAANNPECGRVGAWGVGCDTPVQAVSWGVIKSMFR